ncbi:MAG: alpha/beta hydrolase, partial [Proteobacteria bacterium]|nr:alpha/beta hydrolase [Pseudomonadota bacterium]
RAAIDYVTSRDEVDTSRIAFSGTSYGAVTAICAAAADDRISAVIAQGGWGNSAKWFRFLHPPGAAWDKFQAMLKRGRDNLGSSSPEMVHRFDIVPIPEHLRANIAGPSAFDFQVDTAVATYAFNPEDYVGQVAPRPLMLIHAAHDGVVPASGSVDLFENSGEGAELYIMTDADHFMFGEDNPRVINLVKDWLDRFFPVHPEVSP